MWRLQVPSLDHAMSDFYAKTFCLSVVISSDEKAVFDGMLRHPNHLSPKDKGDRQ
jgi:hypothetical protein